MARDDDDDDGGSLGNASSATGAAVGYRTDMEQSNAVCEVDKFCVFDESGHVEPTNVCDSSRSGVGVGVGLEAQAKCSFVFARPLVADGGIGSR